MDGIRRSATDVSVSINNTQADEPTDPAVSKPNGLIGIPDQIEQSQPALSPEWTSMNQHDPGITMLELPSFLSESLLYHADQISQHSPHLSSVAQDLTKPFYGNTLQAMQKTEASRDLETFQDQLQKTTDPGVYAVLGDMNDGDIMAIAFLVMMQAAKSAQEDLKSIMDGVKSINQEKAGLRENLNSLKSDAASASGATDTDSDFSLKKRFLTAASDALSIYEAQVSSNDDDDDKP